MKLIVSSESERVIEGKRRRKGGGGTPIKRQRETERERERTYHQHSHTAPFLLLRYVRCNKKQVKVVQKQ